jgi:hypothetical protein
VIFEVRFSFGFDISFTIDTCPSKRDILHQPCLITVFFENQKFLEIFQDDRGEFLRKNNAFAFNIFNKAILGDSVNCSLVCVYLDLRRVLREASGPGLNHVDGFVLE